MIKQLVLATHNKHKAEELQAMLAGAGIEVLTLDTFPEIGDIVEDAETLEGNALIKAREVFRHTNLPSLADDTGLEVQFLDGKPGVYSARYAGPRATYADNVQKLLKELNDVSQGHRRAQFRSVLAFVAPEGFERLREGVCSGEIIVEPRGSGGFGYDSVFLPAGYPQTFAEMNSQLKNTVSHRAKAMMDIKPVLLRYFE